MLDQPRSFLALCPCFVALACGGPAENAPAAGGTSGAGGNGAVAGSAGSSSGGVTGSAGSSSGGGGSSAGGAGSPSGGQAGSGGGGHAGMGGSAGTGGGGGETPPEGVPADYTLALDLPFATQADVSLLLAGNPSAWTFDAADGGALKFTGAGYTAPSPINESLSSFAIVPTTVLTSFVLDVELAQLNPDTQQPHRDLCIVFSATDHRHFLYAHIAATHDERSHNIHLIDNAPRQPITVMNSGGIMWGDVGSWHKLRLVRDADGGAISVFFDGKLDAPILTATDTQHPSGYVGFGTFQDSGKVRNLKVWAKGAQQAPAPGTFFTQ